MTHRVEMKPGAEEDAPVGRRPDVDASPHHTRPAEPAGSSLATRGSWAASDDPAWWARIANPDPHAVRETASGGYAANAAPGISPSIRPGGSTRIDRHPIEHSF
jgi:hypothetical protein